MLVCGAHAHVRMVCMWLVQRFVLHGGKARVGHAPPVKASQHAGQLGI
jgi:hypothetical protein